MRPPQRDSFPAAEPWRAKVLIVEDDAAQAALARHLVEAVGAKVVGVATTGDDAVAQAAHADVILLDYQLEGTMTGLDVLREVRQRRIRAAVIVNTAHGSERVAAEALRLGADDYVIKDDAFTEMLPRVLNRVLRIHEVERALAEAEAQLLRAERRAAIGEITIAVSHEMNNPLMALRTQLELLKLDGAMLSPAMRANLDSALQQVDRITIVVRQIAKHDHESSTTYVGGMKMTDLLGGQSAGTP